VQTLRREMEARERQFAAADDRVKLKKPYPTIKP
jgi:hypothetical protein